MFIGRNQEPKMMDLYYIEDDPNIASAVKEYLEQKGFRVTICAARTIMW